MTDVYVNAKIKEALEATGDDKRDAQKLLITWAVRDQELLLGLAKPHLKGLVNARVEEVLRSIKKSGSGEREKEGDDELEVLMKDVSAQGKKRNLSKVPPPKSSSRQASVMQQIAAAFKKK